MVNCPIPSPPACRSTKNCARPDTPRLPLALSSFGRELFNLKSNNQYLPPQDQGQRLPADVTQEESILCWIDLMRTTDKLMLARFATEVGEENAEDAYRQWLREQVRRPRPHKEKLARVINSMGEHE